MVYDLWVRSRYLFFWTPGGLCHHQNNDGRTIAMGEGGGCGDDDKEFSGGCGAIVVVVVMLLVVVVVVVMVVVVMVMTLIMIIIVMTNTMTTIMVMWQKKGEKEKEERKNEKSKCSNGPYSPYLQDSFVVISLTLSTITNIWSCFMQHYNRMAHEFWISSKHVTFSEHQGHLNRNQTVELSRV